MQWKGAKRQLEATTDDCARAANQRMTTSGAGSGGCGGGCGGGGALLKVASASRWWPRAQHLLSLPLVLKERVGRLLLAKRHEDFTLDQRCVCECACMRASLAITLSMSLNSLTWYFCFGITCVRCVVRVR